MAVIITDTCISCDACLDGGFEDMIDYEEFLCFCEQWDIEPLNESSDWEQQYRDNIEYMETGEGYPTGLRS